MQNPAADQVVKALKDANNVMVTVKNGPSVDELTAAIGLTLILNHMGKHAITVFSGRVPSTIEFLQPETAIDTNTDSLRDFIIALDKSKADKLRYKVEDNVVRIFITPYKTSISEKDLEFSQGDFNVDVVVALGVVTKEDFDQAVTTHGRILHDATVVALTKHDVISQIGAINWQEQRASSVSEMIASIVDRLGENMLDGQIATALMTGIVSETDRFRNANTTPEVLTLSAKLMSAGANQLLIAEKLEEPEAIPAIIDSGYGNAPTDDGTLEIRHEESEDEISRIHIDDSGNLNELPEDAEDPTMAGPFESSIPMPMGPLPDEQVGQAEQPGGDFTNRNYLRPLVAPRMYATDDSGMVNSESLISQQQSPPDMLPSPLMPPLESPAEEAAHRRMTLEPLSGQGLTEQIPDINELPLPLEMPAKYEVPLYGAPQPLPPPDPIEVDTTQTLSDLEQAVGRVHAEEEQKVEDFLGTTRVTVTPEPEDEQQEPQQEPLLAAPPELTSEQEEKEEPKEEDETLQAPPQVIDPNAAPEVPPPLMPLAPSQPQFFDANGKNNNPFLNPNQ